MLEVGPSGAATPGKIAPTAALPAVAPRSAALLFFLFALLLTTAAGMMMFSTFMLYDDEGYVLVSLRNFAEHGHLYGEVFTQYGPFPYVLYSALHVLGMPLTHTAGRLITIAAWSGSALACAGLVGRATANLPTRLAVLASVFIYLWIMVSEPTHPGGLIAVATALLAYLGHRWISDARYRAWAKLAGGGTAALFLTKINIGVFVGFAAVTWLLLNYEDRRIRIWATRALVVVTVLVPFGLMRTLLDAPWVQTYAILFACSGAAAVSAAALSSAPRVGWAEARSGLLAALAVAVIVVGVVLARGTTPAQMLEGILLAPLRHPGAFSLNFPWPRVTRLVAVFSLALFVVAWWSRQSRSELVHSVVAWLRIAVVLALMTTITRFPGISPDNLVFAFAAPCLWCFLWPLPAEAPALVAARNWVGLLFLLQCLHAFPVPGSQIAWGTFLALPLAVLGAWPAGAWLAQRFALTSSNARRCAQATGVLLIGFAMLMAGRFIQVGNRYLEGRTLNLTGSGPLRLPEDATALYRALALNASAHSDRLFSLPGMFSLNLWSETPTPTLSNVTHWFSLLNQSRQEEIVRELQAHPRSSVIVQRDHVEFLQKRNLAPSGLVYDFVTANYESAFEIAGFEFRVRKGRRVAPLLTAELFTSQAAVDKLGPESTLLKLCLLLPEGREIQSVELIPLHGMRTPPLLLSAANSRVETTPINFAGDPVGPTIPRRFPFAPNGPTVVGLYFDLTGHRFELAKTLVVVRAANGEELALLRILP